MQIKEQPVLKIKIPDCDLEKISKSGQCFRMTPIEDGPPEEKGKRYCLIAWGEYLEMEETEDGIRFSCTEEEWNRLWKNYFDCGTDYGEIYRAVDKSDVYMRTAVSYGEGIRILRQELFETIICFIISQQNNIARIKKCVETLCVRYGEERIDFRGNKYHVFPTPKQLAAVSVLELQDCNLGYRSRYIKSSSAMIAEGKVNLRRLCELPCEEAKKELLRLSGVGVKVADCICLFALHHVDSFPVDTHIQAVLVKYYKDGFPFEKYAGFAGILQQYAFYYDIYGEKEKR